MGPKVPHIVGAEGSIAPCPPTPTGTSHGGREPLQIMLSTLNPWSHSRRILWLMVLKAAERTRELGQLYHCHPKPSNGQQQAQLMPSQCYTPAWTQAEKDPDNLLDPDNIWRLLNFMVGIWLLQRMIVSAGMFIFFFFGCQLTAFCKKDNDLKY